MFSVKLVLTQTFEKAFRHLLFGSLAFSFMPPRWRGHMTVLVFEGPLMGGLAVKVIAVFPFRCQVAF